MPLGELLAFPLGEVSVTPDTSAQSPSNVSQPGRSPQITNGDYTLNGNTLAFVGIPNNIPSLKSYIGQLVKSRLGLFQGEYEPNALEGMPWYQSILIKGYNINVVRGAFNKRILETPGISSIKSLVLNFNNAQRLLSVSFQAQSDVGLIADQFILPLVQQPLGS